jgi:hypothetical protein
MYKATIIDQPDGEFLAYANSLNDQCTTHAAEWNIDPARLSVLNTLTLNASTAYKLNTDLATRSHLTSVNKRSAFEELKHFLRFFIYYLKGNLSTPDAALETMHISPRVRHMREPLPPPGEAPVITVVRQHGEMTIYVSRAEHGHPTGSAKRKPYHGFKLRWRFKGETVYRIEISTRLQITLHFEREDETKRIEMSAAWINPRLQEGPWSNDVTEIVG